MTAERTQALVQAAALALIPIASTVLMILLCTRAANGRLARNQWVGIRTRATMRNDQSWAAGHRAALRLTPLLILISIAGCVATAWAALATSNPNTVMLTGIGVAALVVIVLIYSAVLANRAANAVGSAPPGQRRQ
ncbi:SdpI family protein [Mycobacterium sp.]|uniref:SdpI family protein n=1 Tax=Mycobacterium sp. TaxID=1785 RepID=UPI0025F211F0|nr:SdpI family protein [Mycobacterium sp.]